MLRAAKKKKLIINASGPLYSFTRYKSDISIKNLREGVYKIEIKLIWTINTYYNVQKNHKHKKAPTYDLQGLIRHPGWKPVVCTAPKYCTQAGPKIKQLNI